ncbi:MAG: flagellar biosynthesis anti-sigma factor FlgM [Methylococcaceae bacterium]
MAIELIKNGVGISPPFKSTPKNSEPTENIAISIAETNITVSGDSVSITNTMIEIRKSFNSSTESSVDAERLAKMERIKYAIESGTYQIDPDRIARKMLQFDFLGQGNST